MSFDFILKSFLLGLISASGMLAAVAWLSKKIITYFLDKELTKYKGDLKSAYDAKLEEIRTNHVISELEHEVRFKSLHQKRFELIADLYAKFVDLHLAMQNYTKAMVSTVDLPEEKRSEVAGDRYNDFIGFYFRNKVFFAPDECSRIDEYLKLVFSIHVDFSYRKLSGSEKKTWMEIDGKMEKEVSDLKGVIEDKFRAKLGIMDAKHN